MPHHMASGMEAKASASGGMLRLVHQASRGDKQDDDGEEHQAELILLQPEDIIECLQGARVVGQLKNPEKAE